MMNGGNMTKALRQQMSEGQRMISRAEFAYGFKDISREQFDAAVKQGNDMILAALDAQLLPENNRAGSQILTAAASRIVLSKGGRSNLSLQDGTWRAVGILERLAEWCKTDEYVRASDAQSVQKNSLDTQIG